MSPAPSRTLRCREPRSPPSYAPYYGEGLAAASSNMVVDPVYGGPGYFGETLVSSVKAGIDGSASFVADGNLDSNSAIFQGLRPALSQGRRGQ